MMLLRAHVEALFTMDMSGRLVSTNEPDAKPAPQFFLGRTTDGHKWWARSDLTPDVLQELNTAVATLPTGMENEASPEIATEFKDILERSGPVQTIWSGPALCFPDHLGENTSAVAITEANAYVLRPHLEAWSEDVEDGKTLYAVVVDGQAVSVCGSVRETSFAHEAGVETAAVFRGQGYAGQAVLGWAIAVRMQNRIPLYSTSWSNAASRTVARKLGLIQFASDLHIT